MISQNAKQFNQAIPAYSYTQYDALGRITEVGEVTTGQRVETLEDASGQIDQEKLEGWVANGSRGQITRTYYDEVVYEVPGFEQAHLRNRVSSTTYQREEGEGYDYATHYSYDIHGNVQTLIQDNPALAAINQQYKRMDYDYDLISGNVHEVAYQKNQGDQFFHRYAYDADNRIVEVQTSSDGIIWDRDAGYEYYQHGPLARMELGQQQVQGVDYAYTIQGWLKGVNSTSLNAEKDMGRDGTSGSAMAKDEFGYSLSYFDGDYSAINAPSSDLDVQVGNNLYNGNIRNMTTSIRKFMGVNGQGPTRTGSPQTMAYQYDQLNRLTESQAYDNVNGTLTEKPDYKTSYSYDANGNLLSLHRNATTAEGRQLLMDELEYVYENKANGYQRNTNKLRQVRDAISASNYSDDIDTQQRDNYAYDEIGNLVEDKQEGITNIDWTVYGKVQRVNKADGSFVEFAYDAAGNRIAKRFKNQAEDRTTHYVRDASGNVMSIYEQSGASFKLIEQSIYGSDMVGQRTLAIDLTEGATDSEVTTHSVGVKAYYLRNHLSNNIVSVSDRKDANGNAVVLSATDYYAFGKAQPGRSYAGNSQIKVGFNGKRKDDEGEFGLTAYDYGFRIYNPDLGKFLSVDPLVFEYPMLTPYQFASNRPIDGVDLDGLEYESNTHFQKDMITGQETVIKRENNAKTLSRSYWPGVTSNFTVTTNYFLKVNLGNGESENYTLNSSQTFEGRDAVKRSNNRFTGVSSLDRSDLIVLVKHGMNIIENKYNGSAWDAAKAESGAKDANDPINTGGALDYKFLFETLVDVPWDNLIEIDGVTYNANEAGNYVWSLVLEYGGITGSEGKIPSIGAEAVTLKSSLLRAIQTSNPNIIRFDEPHEQKAIISGGKAGDRLKEDKQFVRDVENKD